MRENLRQESAHEEVFGNTRLVQWHKQPPVGVHEQLRHNVERKRQISHEKHKQPFEVGPKEYQKEAQRNDGPIAPAQESQLT